MTRVARALFCLLLLAAAWGCTQPFVPLEGRLVSLPWGVQVSLPAGARLSSYEKGAAYVVADDGSWTLALATRRPPRGAPAYAEIGEKEARALIEEGKRIAAGLPDVHVSRWEARSLGLRPAVQVAFEGPAGEGQEALPFTPGERLGHRMALVEANRRLYRLHLRFRPAARKEAQAFWSLLERQTRFTGQPSVGFPGSENMPRATLGEMLREGLADGGSS